MEEECNSVISISEQSNSKITGEKRTSAHLREKHELPRKRVKMRDLESVVQSAAETSTHYSEFTKGKQEKEMTQITEVPVTVDMDASEEYITARNMIEVEFVDHASRPLDLNTEACGSLGKGGGCVENLSEVSLHDKQEKKQQNNLVISRGINLDLNAEDVTSPINLEAAQYQKGHGHFKSKDKDVSQTESCTGLLEEKDPMSIWKEMKQNGFLSSSHGGIPAPKQRGRKSKSDMLKKKMEIAKREQVNRFTKIAAPSGLLNELNPGIINHVRNRKQVHSIIEALVRSEQNENSSAGSKQITRRMNLNARLEYMADGSKHQPTFPLEEGTLYSGSRQIRKYPGTADDYPGIFHSKVHDRGTCILEKSSLKSCISNSTHLREDDILALKFSSSIKELLSSSTLSNEELSNFSVIPSLSLKAATVASQWLELLHQDIKGRLSALRRSRRRVRAVITTELPFLLAKEFGNNQENDPFAMKLTAVLPTSKTADLHRARWTALFDHMDEALSEEEKQLESWLNQVKEKQLLCDQGLQHVNWSVGGLQQLGTSESDSRIPVPNGSEKELAVNAAAASIYSTCNFLLSEG